MKILFLHGLASSGAYKMASSLRILVKGSEVLSPDLPPDPMEALELIRRCCNAERPDLVVGLSMGGFLAQKLRGQRKVLVNPDFHISRLARTMVGEVKYLSPRRDGAESFQMTEAICDRFEALERTQFDGLDEAEAARTRGFFADHDEMVDCSAEFERYYPGRGIRYPGGHLPNYPEIKTYILPHLLP